jgi:hypothetical protein
MAAAASQTDSVPAAESAVVITGDAQVHRMNLTFR